MPKLATLAASPGRTANPLDFPEGSPVQVRVYQPREWPAIMPIWAELANISPYSSFFLSSDWVAVWLHVFGESLRPEILVFEEAGVAIGACVLTRITERRGPFALTRIYLNGGGEPKPERTAIDFNNILCRSGKEQTIARALGTYLQRQKWDEFAIQAISPGPVLTSIQSVGIGQGPAMVRVRHTFAVDLYALRQAQSSYLDSLSSNTRAQVRQSIRTYSALGELRVEVARDLASAEKFFSEMGSLHQRRWTSRGETGAFGPGRRLEFHRALIRQAFRSGSIHLLRVSAGGETIGILYNFVQGGKIFFFQSGFNYHEHSNFRPGLVTHAYAIQHYLNAGFKEYDFLAGEARYKSSLAESAHPLAWVVFSRPSLKLSSLELMRAIKQRIRMR